MVGFKLFRFDYSSSQPAANSEYTSLTTFPSSAPALLGSKDGRIVIRGAQNQKDLSSELYEGAICEERILHLRENDCKEPSKYTEHEELGENPVPHHEDIGSCPKKSTFLGSQYEFHERSNSSVQNASFNDDISQMECFPGNEFSIFQSQNLAYTNLDTVSKCQSKREEQSDKCIKWDDENKDSHDFSNSQGNTHSSFCNNETPQQKSPCQQSLSPKIQLQSEHEKSSSTTCPQESYDSLLESNESSCVWNTGNVTEQIRSQDKGNVLSRNQGLDTAGAQLQPICLNENDEHGQREDETTDLKDSGQRVSNCCQMNAHFKHEISHEIVPCHQSLFSKENCFERETLNCFSQKSRNFLCRKDEPNCLLYAENISAIICSKGKSKAEHQDEHCLPLSSSISLKDINLSSKNEKNTNRHLLSTHTETDAFDNCEKVDSQLKQGNDEKTKNELKQSNEFSSFSQDLEKTPCTDSQITKHAMIIEDVVAGCVSISDKDLKAGKVLNKMVDDLHNTIKNDNESANAKDRMTDCSYTDCPAILSSSAQNNKKIAAQEENVQKCTGTSDTRAPDSQEEPKTTQYSYVRSYHQSFQLENIDKPEDFVSISNFNSSQGELIFSPLYSKSPYRSNKEVAIHCLEKSQGRELTTVLQFSPLLSQNCEKKPSLLSECQNIDNEITTSLSQVSIEPNITNEQQFENGQNLSDDELPTPEQDHKTGAENVVREIEEDCENFNNCQKTPSDEIYSRSHPPPLATFSPLSSSQISSENEMTEEKTNEYEIELQIGEAQSEEKIVNLKHQDLNKNDVMNQDVYPRNKELINNTGSCFHKPEKETGMESNSNLLITDKSNNCLALTKEHRKEMYCKELTDERGRIITINSYIINGGNDVEEMISDDKPLCRQKGIFSVLDDNGAVNNGSNDAACKIQLESEQVVPGSCAEVDDGKRVDEPFYDSQEAILLKDKRSYHPCFQWKCIQDSTPNGDCISIQGPQNLPNVVPLPPAMKRARPIRIGLSKKQKVKRLHQK